MPNYSTGDFRLASELPPDIALEAQGVNQRQRIADFLMQQGLQPIQPPEVKGRFQGRISPWQGVAQLAKTGVGAVSTALNQRAMQGLAEKDRAHYEADMAKIPGFGPPDVNASASAKADARAVAEAMAIAQEQQGPNRDRPAGYAATAPALPGSEAGPMMENPAMTTGALEGGSPPAVQQVANAMAPTPPPAMAAALQPPDQSYLTQMKTPSGYRMAKDKADRDMQLYRDKLQQEARAHEGVENREARHQDRLVAIDSQYALQKMQLEMNLSNQSITQAEGHKNRTQLQTQHEAAIAQENMRDRVARKDLRRMDLDDKKEARAETKDKPLPVSAAQKLMENQQNLRRAEQALSLITGGVVKDQQGNVIAKGDKDATGVKGMLPDVLLQRIDPSGVETRAAISDLGSLLIHERSGATVTVAESPRLKPFIPLPSDNPETARKKLTKFIHAYRDIVEEATEFYKESGYKVPEHALRGSGTAHAPSLEPRVMDKEMSESIDSILEKYK